MAAWLPDLMTGGVSAPDRRSPAHSPSIGGLSRLRVEPAALIVVVIGIALRLLQFFIDRSLYIDEAALSLNLRDRGWLELFTQPLDHGQTAPIGFLALQKLAMLLMGTGEQVQRIIPLLAGIASVPLFYHLARRFLSGLALLGVLVLFASSVPLVFASALAKPYALDVLAAVVLLGMGAQLAASGSIRAHSIMFGCTAGIASLLSQPSVLLTSGMLAGLLLLSIARADYGRSVGVVLAGAIWAIGALPAVIYAMNTLDPQGREYMLDFWAAGFAPLPPATPEQWLWYPRALLRLVGSTLNALPALPLVVLFMLGMIMSARRRPVLFALAAGPLLATLGASAAMLYPWSIGGVGMSGRVLLFLAPIVLLGVGEGLSYLLDQLKHRALHVAVVVIATVPAVLPAALVLPIYEDELRPALEYVRTERQLGEALYIYYGARHPYSFYRLADDSTSGPLLLGRCARDQPAKYAEDVALIAAHDRAWVVIAHPVLGEDAVLTDLLDLRGTQRASESWPGAKAMLYDFSIPSQTGSPHIPPAPVRWQKIGCRGIHATMRFEE